MTLMAVRDAKPDEASAVAAVLLESYDEYAPGFGDNPLAESDWDAYRGTLRDVRGRMAAGVRVLVAERGSSIVGTAAYLPPGVAEGEGWPASWAGIRLVGVIPSARGGGVGRALTEDCIGRARSDGAPVVGLHTTRLMRIAREMYERTGFVRYPENDFRVGDLTIEAYRLDLPGEAHQLSSSAENRPG